MSKRLAGKSPSSPLVSNIWLLWQETHLALWPESIAPPQPSVHFLCLGWINLRLTYINPPKLPKLLVFRTDVSNPRCQVGVMCSVRVGLLSIMGKHSCVLSTICRNFCPCPKSNLKKKLHISEGGSAGMPVKWQRGENLLTTNMTINQS